jgi:hypothetical protein
VAEGRDFSNYVLLLPVGSYHVTKLVLYEKYFGWMAFWELNPEVLVSLWTMTFATWGGITMTGSLNDSGKWMVPLLNYTFSFSLQLRKSTESLSQGSS